ncbi:MAG: hypothetical protein NC489_34820, partial [Ruminococcus flavefaciens]|nr:hypothetical protein [Ruminococcus flavefaciens]
MRAREAILVKRNAANREEGKEATPPVHGIAESQTPGGTGQEGSARDFLSLTQGHTDTDGNPFAANDMMPSLTEIHLRQTTERKNKWKFAHSDRQDFETRGNSFSEAAG